MSDMSTLVTEHMNEIEKANAPAQEAQVTITAPVIEHQTVVSKEQPTQTQAERRALKVKVDGAEEEIDLDEWWKDEAKRGQLRETLEKGRSFDTVVKRREQARIDGQREALDWVRSQGFDIQQDPTDQKWKIASRQKAMSAEPTQPQSNAKDPAVLLAQAREGNAEAIAELFSLTQSQVAQIQKAAEEKRAAEERAREETQRTENAKQWGAYIAQRIKAREKSFEGPQAKALKEQVFRAAWAEVTSNPNATGDSVAALIEAHANALDAHIAEVAKRYTATKPSASTPPVLNGAAPASATTGPAFDGDPSDRKGLEAYLKSLGHE